MRSAFCQTGPGFLRDEAVALAALGQADRHVLLAVATGHDTCGELAAVKHGRGLVRFREDAGGMPQPEQFAALLDCLCEAGAGDDVLRLQPPYAWLITSWVCKNGDLAVGFNGDLIDLNDPTRMNLALFAEPAQRQRVGARLQAAVSSAVLASLARHGVGVVHTDGSVRPRATAAELDAVPALHVLRDTLACSPLPGIDRRETSLYNVLQAAAAAAPATAEGGHRIAVMDGLREPPAELAIKAMGWELLLAFRSASEYSWMYQPVERCEDGLTATAAVDAQRRPSWQIRSKAASGFIRLITSC